MNKHFFFISCLFAVKGMTMHCKWELPTLPETLSLESYNLQKTRAAAPLFDAGALNNHRTVPLGRNKSFFLPDENDNWASFWEHQPLPSAESWIGTFSLSGSVQVFSCTVWCFASWSIASEEDTRDKCFCPSIGATATSDGKRLYRPKNTLAAVYFCQWLFQCTTLKQNNIATLWAGLLWTRKGETVLISLWKRHLYCILTTCDWLLT